MPSRRHVLALGVSTGSVLAAGLLHRSASGSTITPVADETPFSVRMPVPIVKQPYGTHNGTDLYRIAIRPADVEILRGKRTAVFGYDGQFGGPTIRARSGRPVAVEFTNRLAEPTNVHLHGGHVPAAHDGFPMDLIEPGRRRTYLYPNKQRAATLWYHDHAHHMEAEHVYRGLHGFYLLDDERTDRLGLPAGAYDVPILIRDAEFDTAGTLLYGIDRPTLLANGKPRPYFPVAARRYRFRLLNAANLRYLQLTLGDGETVTQIGSDGGLLAAPQRVQVLRMSAGERQEIVVDFARYPVGTQLVLSDAEAGPILRFDVTARKADNSRVPATLPPLPALRPATVERDFDLSFDMTADPIGLINGRPFDENRVDFTIKRGDTEIWRVHNTDPIGVDHNFHLHMTQFRVLDRDGVPPGPEDAGLKDTVHVPAGSRNVRLQATFPDYVGRYVLHCHMLEHSAIGMMAVLEVVP